MFDIVSVMVMLFLGRRSFSRRLRFFREGFKFLEWWRCFRKCLGFFREGLGLFPWCSGDLFRGFERFLGGGGGRDIFRVINFYFNVHGKIEA